MNKINTGSDFSGVGAFDQALSRLGIKQNKLFACDWDKYARQTYIYNYGEPDYYPSDVYDREIPEQSLDIYMTSPPCQSFSLAGKRQGENSDKGVLFYNSHEFITKNKPRYFIFENVKGLLSDNGGKTFQRWIDYLGGKSVNGNPVIFPNEKATPYHVYYQVMNAKHYGVPQNRERIFIIGIRDDADNVFSFPKPFHLVKRLKDVLENEVDPKYFLSDKMIESFTTHKERHDDKGTGFSFAPKNETDIANCLRANAAICPTDNMLKVVGDLNKGGERGAVYCESSTIMSCLSATDYKQPKQIQISISANTAKGYDIATENDSINFSVPTSETRRGRVGKGVAQTLDTACNQGVLVRNNVVVEFNLPGNHEQNSRVYGKNGVAPSLTTMQGGGQEPKITSNQKIRRLTPKECFRLMDFNNDFKWNVSDSQAYKQAGNSIVVNCLVEIIKKLKLNQL
jgi:DNA (cytosine-5)-methyltransferase 1